jgi:hypothetical protein
VKKTLGHVTLGMPWTHRARDFKRIGVGVVVIWVFGLGTKTWLPTPTSFKQKRRVAPPLRISAFRPKFRR